MSSFDPSMKPMLDTFIYETTTLLEQLDEIMLEAEEEKELSIDEINEIFRFMHTIKGSAAMMGIQSIATLAHAVEDVFFILRQTPAKLKMVNEAIFDIVFQASDFFKDEVDAIQNDDYTAQDSSAIISNLESQVAILNGEDISKTSAVAVAQKEKKPKPEKEEIDIDDDFTKVRVFFTDDCQMENIRAFMLLTQLKDWCSYLDSVPSNPENDSSLCEEIINNGFLIKFKPNTNVQDVYRVIESSINVKSYNVIEDTEQKPEPPKDEKAKPKDSPDVTFVKAPNNTSDQSSGASKNIHQIISVNQEKLDQLMDLVGELVTTESMVVSSPDLKGLPLDNFNKSIRELRKLTNELQDVVMSMRMMPLSGVYQKMKRIVRDMSKKLERKVNLVTIGGDTEMDKTINDALTDPFIHMIRNSMDHAIESPEERVKLSKPESGTITMSAKNIGGEIVITISDDGRGLNKEQIINKAKAKGILTKPESEYSEKEIFGLIMLPGFSTNEEVTEFSGRGVGMDVVRQNIEKIGGIISVESTKNVGTTFTIKIPLTLVIIDGMEISVGNTIFTLPITSIRQTFKLSDKKNIIYNTNNTELIRLNGECYPVIRLHDMYNIEAKNTDLTSGIIIQIENGDNIACLFVDELIGELQVVVKPFPAYFNTADIKKSGMSGCTILGDGSISLILDASNLISCHSSNTK